MFSSRNKKNIMWIPLFSVAMVKASVLRTIFKGTPSQAKVHHKECLYAKGDQYLVHVPQALMHVRHLLSMLVFVWSQNSFEFSNTLSLLEFGGTLKYLVQSTLVISTSLISNNHLS